MDWPTDELLWEWTSWKLATLCATCNHHSDQDGDGDHLKRSSPLNKAKKRNHILIIMFSYTRLQEKLKWSIEHCLVYKWCNV